MVRLAFAVALVLGLALSPPVSAQTEAPSLTREQMATFMATAKIVSTRQAPKGVTRPLRMTLSDGVITHDAVFQAVDEKKAVGRSPMGEAEVNFVDSWRYNVAAYRLAELLDLAEMMPVTIEYRYRGKQGALAWWMDALMDEGERLKKKVQPPDTAAWNDDMYRQRVFMELVFDTDRNVGNVLISPQWRVIMLDFTRAFRLWPTIRAGELHRIDRRLLARLQALSADAITASAKEFLTPGEVSAVMVRRDLIVTHYTERVRQLGEARVLY